MNTLYVNNSNVVEIVLQDALDNSYLNSATVTMTLVTTSGTQVSGETWPVTLSYLASSDGVYRYTLSSSLDISSGTKYIGQITSDSSGNVGYWEIPIQAETRTQ